MDNGSYNRIYDALDTLSDDDLVKVHKQNAQRIKEEAAELVVAMSHRERRRILIDKLYEEMADVEICIMTELAIWQIRTRRDGIKLGRSANPCPEIHIYDQAYERKLERFCKKVKSGEVLEVCL